MRGDNPSRKEKLHRIFTFPSKRTNLKTVGMARSYFQLFSLSLSQISHNFFAIFGSSVYSIQCLCRAPTVSQTSKIDLYLQYCCLVPYRSHSHIVWLSQSSCFHTAYFFVQVLNARLKDPRFCWAFFPSNNLFACIRIAQLWPKYLRIPYDHSHDGLINL